MKRTGILFTVAVIGALTANLAGQQAPAAKPAPEVARTNLVEKAMAPTENDMYCSGYISSAAVSTTQFVGSGADAPFQTRYSDRQTVFLTGGSYAKDQKFQIVRPIQDINNYDVYKNQRKLAKAAGTMIQEVGRVRVVDVQKNIGIALVEQSCDGIVPGDLVIAWPERPAPQFRREAPFDFYAPPNGKTSGRIIAGTEFDTLSSQRGKVYLNIGANSGLKPGDYFRVTRTYESLVNDDADGISLKASVVEPTTLNAPTWPLKTNQMGAASGHAGDLPRKSIAELMVLHATGSTATATVTRSWEQVQVGDFVEMMDELPPLPPAAANAAANPPAIHCAASPATVHVGENATIRCTATSADDRPLAFNWSADNGQIIGRNDVATLDTRNARPGVVAVMATVSDDRNLSASATTSVNIERAAAIEPSRAGDLMFKANSARVDNAAKAMLDDLALRLQRETGSAMMLAGYAAEGESGRLSSTRAGNAMNYLVNEKGIDAARVHTGDGGRGGQIVQMWYVPAGAQMPTVAPSAPAAVKPGAKPIPKAAATATPATAKPKPKPKP